MCAFLFRSQGHSVAWRPVLDFQHLIGIYVDSLIGSHGDERPAMILARFTCPYCEAELDLVAEMHDGEQLIAECEQVQREFGIRLGDNTASH